MKVGTSLSWNEDSNLARTFFLDCRRIVEHLHADPLFDLLGQCGDKNRLVDCLIGVECRESTNSRLRWSAGIASNAATVHDTISREILFEQRERAQLRSRFQASFQAGIGAPCASYLTRSR